MKIACPNCNASVEAILSASQIDVVCDNCQSKFNLIGMLSINQELSQTKTMDSVEMPAQKGDQIAHFKITGQLGAGGFGCVFEAHDSRLDRKVALKLPRMARMNPKYAKVFIREAQAAAQLKNSNIVSVFEIGRDGDQIYIVSELIEGETLNQWAESERPKPKRIAQTLATIARALDAAHKAGIIHRDIKPRNIIVDAEDQPHITDFGLAKRVTDTEGSISRPGNIMGTPAYMSPEQASGRADEADGRSDIYSMGVMLYEMLLRKRPYRGETDTIYEEILQGDAEPPCEVDPIIHPDISAICMKAMSRKLGDRYRTALEFAEELERFNQGMPTLTRPLNWVETTTRLVKRNAALSALLATIVALAGLLVINLADSKNAGKKIHTISVEFRTIPSKSDVVIAKVNHVTGRVDKESLIVPDFNEEKQKFIVDLEPGFYIVEASTPGHGLNEVRRTASTSIAERRRDYSHRNFNILDSNRIEWDDISIPKTQNYDDLSELQLVSGVKLTRILGGNGFNASAMKIKNKSANINDFFIGNSIINAGEYRKVMKKLPVQMVKKFRFENILEDNIPDSAPVTFVTYFDVLEFCERTSSRPMLLAEYLFVVTNAGTTKYPWGDQQPPDWQTNWGPKRSPIVRQNVRDYNSLRDMYSGEMEWTQEFFLPTDTITGDVFKAGMMGGFGSDARMVVDGPPPFAHGYSFEDKYAGDVRLLTSVSTTTAAPHVGFRIAIGTKPRFLPIVQKRSSDR